MGRYNTWSVTSIKNIKGSQQDDIKNEGKHRAGGKLQHSGLMKKSKK